MKTHFDFLLYLNIAIQQFKDKIHTTRDYRTTSIFTFKSTHVKLICPFVMCMENWEINLHQVLFENFFIQFEI